MKKLNIFDEYTTPIRWKNTVKIDAKSDRRASVSHFGAIAGVCAVAVIATAGVIIVNKGDDKITPATSSSQVQAVTSVTTSSPDSTSTLPTEIENPFENGYLLQYLVITKVDKQNSTITVKSKDGYEIPIGLDFNKVKIYNFKGEAMEPKVGDVISKIETSDRDIASIYSTTPKLCDDYKVTVCTWAEMFSGVSITNVDKSNNTITVSWVSWWGEGRYQTVVKLPTDTNKIYNPFGDKTIELKPGDIVSIKPSSTAMETLSSNIMLCEEITVDCCDSSSDHMLANVIVTKIDKQNNCITVEDKGFEIQICIPLDKIEITFLGEKINELKIGDEITIGPDGCATTVNFRKVSWSDYDCDIIVWSREKTPEAATTKKVTDTNKVTGSKETSASEFEYQIKNGKVTITNFKGPSTDVIIPSKINGYPVVSIGRGAFTDLFLDQPGDAYYGGRDVKSIVIPEGVTSLDYMAFAHCTKLEKVTIPESVTTMGNGVFCGCYHLKSVTLPKNLKSIDEGCFSECTKLSSIVIPEGVKQIPLGAFDKCSGLESITILGNITAIGTNAFCECTSLKSITLPNSVTSIGEHAFYNCGSLESITIPESIKDIGWCAFLRCDKIELPSWLDYSVRMRAIGADGY